MQVIWTQRALLRLQGIKQYVSADSPKAAVALSERILAAGNKLDQLPRVAQRVREYPQQEIYEIRVRPYRILFTVSDTAIRILSVKHYRQRLPTYLPYL